MAQILRARATLSGWPGGPGLFTWYFVKSATPFVTADATDAVGRVQSFWDAIKAIFPTSFAVDTQPGCDILDDTTGVLVSSLTATAPARVLGTSAAGYNMYAGMFLLKASTAAVVGGRRVVGRSFLGPVQSAADNGGVPDSSYRTAIVNAANGRITGTTSIVLGVWSRPKYTPKPGHVLVRAGTSWPITAFTCPPYFAVLRSRRD